MALDSRIKIRIITSMTIDEVVQNIRNIPREYNLSKNRLAIRAGITEGAIRKMDDPSWNPRLKTLKALEAATNNLPPLAEKGGAE
jgi:predicted transcriptional regulator